MWSFSSLEREKEQRQKRPTVPRGPGLGWGSRPPAQGAGGQGRAGAGLPPAATGSGGGSGLAGAERWEARPGLGPLAPGSRGGWGDGRPGAPARPVWSSTVPPSRLRTRSGGGGCPGEEDTPGQTGTPAPGHIPGWALRAAPPGRAGGGLGVRAADGEDRKGGGARARKLSFRFHLLRPGLRLPAAEGHGPRASLGVWGHLQGSGPESGGRRRAGAAHPAHRRVARGAEPVAAGCLRGAMAADLWSGVGEREEVGGAAAESGAALPQAPGRGFHPQGLQWPRKTSGWPPQSLLPGFRPPDQRQRRDASSGRPSGVPLCLPPCLPAVLGGGLLGLGGP